MRRSILLSMLVIGAAVALVAGAGTFASFSDTETSTGNTFALGTLDLEVNGANPLVGTVCSASNIPGTGGTFACLVDVKNQGSLAGTIGVKIDGDSCVENGEGEAEIPTGHCDLDTAHTSYNIIYDSTPDDDCANDGSILATGATIGTTYSAGGPLAGGGTAAEVCVQVVISSLSNGDQSDQLLVDLIFSIAE